MGKGVMLSIISRGSGSPHPYCYQYFHVINDDHINVFLVYSTTLIKVHHLKFTSCLNWMNQQILNIFLSFAVCYKKQCYKLRKNGRHLTIVNA